MKSASLILLGFVIGVASTVAFIYLGAKYIFNHPRDILTTSDQYITSLTDEHRKSVNLGLNQMIQAKTEKGTALIDFTDYGNEGTESPYRWRFRMPDGSETQGTGVVFENYDRVGTSPTNTTIVDRGGQLQVVAGGLALEWSYGSTTNGWLYYNPRNTSIEVLPDDQFESLTMR